MDYNGEIVGINTWIVSNAQGLSFAVPAKYISEAYGKLPPHDVLLNGFYCPSCGHIEEKE